MKAVELTGIRRLVVSGGVSANANWAATRRRGFAPRRPAHYPELACAPTNGAMIALASAMRLADSALEGDPTYAFDVMPRWPLEAITG